MYRYDIINMLAKKNNAEDYLEVGLSRGRNFVRVDIKNKIGVDPRPRERMGRQNVTHVMTSDEFFEQNHKKFDIIFIDGLHTSEQVYKDINNALTFLNDGGYVICHDMNPSTEGAHDNSCGASGDCWRALVRLRQERGGLNVFVVDTDYGCGVISKAFPYYRGQKKLEINEELSYKGLDGNRKEWLNLISAEEFVVKYV